MKKGLFTTIFLIGLSMFMSTTVFAKDVVIDNPEAIQQYNSWCFGDDYEFYQLEYVKMTVSNVLTESTIGKINNIPQYVKDAEIGKTVVKDNFNVTDDTKVYIVESPMIIQYEGKTKQVEDVKVNRFALKAYNPEFENLYYGYDKERSTLKTEVIDEESGILTATAPGWYVIMTYSGAPDGQAVEDYSFVVKIEASTSTNNPVPQQNSIKVVFKNEPLNLELPIINKNGRTFYPFRNLLEAIGAKVEWDNTSSTAIATLGNNKIEFKINSNNFTVNGEIKEMEKDVTTFIENDRTYIPIRYAVEGLGLTVQWDEATSTICIQ